MGTIKPMRVIYTRIGEQESWSGWNVAGFTPDATPEVTGSCTSRQGKNSSSAKFMYDLLHPAKGESNESAKEVYEFFCTTNPAKSNIFSFTKATFGFLDALGRPQMKAYSVVMAEPANHLPPSCLPNLLTIDKRCFDDFALNLPLLESAKGKSVNLSEVQTQLESKEYTCGEDFLTEEMVGKLFGSRAVYEDFIRCVYWNLSFNSSSSVFVQTDGELDTCINLFLTAFFSVIYPYRTAMSFRTFDFQDSGNQPTLVFCRQIPEGVRYFDTQTGENNILNDKIKRKINRKAFTYYPEHLGEPSAENFFAVLDSKMNSMGRRFSTEIRDLETATTLVTDELDDNVSMSETELLKKIISYCDMPTDDTIDAKIALLIEQVLDENIMLNEDIRRHINNRMSATSSDELIRAGNILTVTTLLSLPQEDAICQLGELYESSTQYKDIVSVLMQKENGADLVDAFYASLAEECPAEMAKVLIILSKILIAGKLPKAMKAIKDKCLEIGISINKRFMQQKTSIVKDMEDYEKFLSVTIPRGDERESMLKAVKSDFWKRFSATNFTYDNQATYRYMSCSNPRQFPKEVFAKSNFYNSLFEVFKTSEKMNPNTVRSFANKLRDAEKSGIIEPDDKQHLVKEMQHYCVDFCDTTKGLDFWIELSKLRGQRQWLPFLFHTGIAMFSDRDLYRRGLEESDNMEDYNFLDAYLRSLEDYALINDSSNVRTTLELTREFKKQKGGKPAKKHVPSSRKTSEIDIMSYSNEHKRQHHIHEETKSSNPISGIKKFFGKK